MSIQQDFIKKIASAAQAVCREAGLRADVCIAQACLESGFGKSAIKTYNVFGRKWGGTPGQQWTEVLTHEWDGTKMVPQYAKFRVYANYEEAIQSYCRLISNPPYQKVKPLAADLNAYVAALGKVYATDPIYQKKILKIIADYNLTQYN